MKKKYEVELISPHNKTEIVDGIKITPIKKPKNLIARFLYGFKVVSLAKKRRADVYHFHDFEFLMGGWLLKLITKKPVIFDSHEFFDIVLENRSWAKSWLRPFLRFFINVYEKLFALRMSRVIVANPLQEKKYQDAVLLLNLPPKENYEKYFGKKDYHKLVYVGNITKDRVVDKINTIRKKLDSEYKIMLVGGLVDKGINKNINYLGFIKNDKLATSLKDVGLGLIPFNNKKQFRISIPSKVFDYMAMGMVIIAPRFVKSSFGSMDITDNVLFVDGSSGSFIRKIKNLSDDPEKMADLSVRNRRAFLDRLNWENEEKKLFGVYKNL